MQNALIGHTGFVGGNLQAQHPEGALFNSKNFRQMENQAFGDVICAGVSARKWWANKNPEEDLVNIQSLMDTLEKASAQRFILISTIDVYPVQQEADEGFDCKEQENHPYGAHRLMFEEFCQSHFSQCFIIRLPGLFGDGLKKNVIFDLLNDNCLEMINPSSSFQYYDLSGLWNDIQTVLKADVRLVNFFTEPVSTVEILDRFFPGKPVGEKPLPEMHYDLRTRHGGVFGQDAPYMCQRDVVLDRLGRFITDDHRAKSK